MTSDSDSKCGSGAALVALPVRRAGAGRPYWHPAGIRILGPDSDNCDSAPDHSGRAAAAAAPAVSRLPVLLSDRATVAQSASGLAHQQITG